MAASSRENKVSPTQTNPHITMHKHWMIEHTSIQPSSSFNTSRFFEGKLIQDPLTILWMKNWRVSSFIKTIKTCLIHLAYFMNRIWWRWDFYVNSTGIYSCLFGYNEERTIEWSWLCQSLCGECVTPRIVYLITDQTQKKTLVCHSTHQLLQEPWQQPHDILNA